MKLIEFLISENKKGWEWPGTIVKATSTKGGRGVNFYFDYACPPSLSNTLIAPVPFSCSETVTREQYEAALAASKPEWNGEGLPPVGTEAEVSVDGGRTWCYYKAASEHNGIRLVEIGNFTEEFQSNNWMFRPIRSEADKKKEKVVDEIMSWMHYAGRAEVELIYDAIKSGKIVID